MTPEPQPVVARRVVVHAGHVRSVTGIDLHPGDVLATGIVLEVTRDDESREVRLEMPGADIHYVGYDEPVLVLASVDRDVLDGVSLGTFVARAETRRPTLRVVTDPEPTEESTVEEPEPVPTVEVAAPTPEIETDREKRNRGRLGQYDEGVQHYTDVCPIHGETTFALHRGGRRQDGTVRFNRRCLKCHADYNLDKQRTR